MSMLPSHHRGGLSHVSRLLDEYGNFLSHRTLPPHEIAFVPTFDVRETKDSYQLEGELPGVKQADIEIEYSDPNTMSIKGHSERVAEEEKKEEEGGSWWISERSTGDFRRSFSFPSAVDQDKTSAKLRDGVLSVTVPKAEKKAETKRIMVGD